MPSTLPQGLRDPPSYASSLPRSSPRTLELAGPPPPYIRRVSTPDDDGDDAELNEKQEPWSQEVDDAPPPRRRQTASPGEEDEKATVTEDTLHFIDHEHDSIASLSLRYNVPAAALRRANNITSDHLLLARRTVIIPGEFYKAGVSLSPRPIEGEEEEQRKGKIRRFMTSCKVSDYDVASLYLEQQGYDLEAAAVAYFDDEAWEREHPNQRRTQSSKDKVEKKPSMWSRFRK